MSGPRCQRELQAVCDTVGQAMKALQAQDDRLTKLNQSVSKLQQSMEVASQLGSLEETVLTLAEALLRPQAPQIPAPREASRDSSRDASRDSSRDASREGSRI